MKNLAFPLLLVFAFFTACQNQPEQHSAKLQYPETKTCDTLRVYFGDTVADPYAWLEDDFSNETVAWTQKQNSLTRQYLDTLSAHKNITKRLTELWSSSSFGTPFRGGDDYYYTYNDGSMNQPVLKRYVNGQDDPVVFDPGQWDQSGLSSANNYSFSKSGKHMAIAISKSGSDWNSIYVFNNDGEQAKDSLNWVKFSGISWMGDDGFLYARYPEPKKGSEYSQKNTFHQVYFHQLGTDQSKDVQVWMDEENPQRTHGASSIKHGEYILLSASESTSGNNLKLAKGLNQPFTTLIKGFDKDYNYLGHHNDFLYFITNDQADNKKIRIYSLVSQKWQDAVSEKNQPLQSAALGKDFMMVKYMDSVISKLYSIRLSDMAVKEIDLGKKGSIGGISSHPESNTFYFSFQNYHTPATIYTYDAESNKVESFFESTLELNPDDFESIQTSYQSKDGTRIPLFITRKKGSKKSADTPCFLYAYGGFNISITPSFSKDYIPFLEAGGIYCVANIRGGSEFGENWHQQGIKTNKQNVFDDFIAAAEFLQKEGYTSKEKLAIHGRSNGGLLAGAILTQRPDLMQVALPKVGVLDMLRYQNFTIGWAWAGDYGRSDDSKEMYQYLKAYSPLHNVKKTDYPATMIITGDHDDRVVPAHSFKFAAEIQKKQQGDDPVLLRVESGGGHGAGKPINLQVREYADQWAFVYHNLGM